MWLSIKSKLMRPPKIAEPIGVDPEFRYGWIAFH